MNRKYINPNKKKDIIKDYLTGTFSVTQLSKKYSESVYKIIRMLRDEDIKVENKSIIPKISENIGNYIIEKYKKDKVSLSALSKELNISIGVISKYLKSKNIDVINYQNISKFNQHVFDTILDDETAYWLGFIFADGYISSTRYCFELSVSIKDKNHLDRFNSFMGYLGDNVKVSSSKFNEKVFTRCRWSVTNKHLWNVLNNYGCVPRKSTSLKFPTAIPKEFIPAFIRGYFDGDGCITGTTKSVNTTILGTEEFLKSIAEYLTILDSNFTYNILTDSRMKYTKVLRIYKRSIKSFFDIIYRGCTICLTRKHNRFIELMNIAVPLRN